MDLQTSGNKNEINIETEKVFVTLKTNDCFGEYDNKCFKLTCDDEIINFTAGIEYIYLKEYTDYELIIENLSNEAIEFYHEDLNIRNKITPVGKKGILHTGIINFKGNIGYSNLVIKINNKDYMIMKAQVFPTKLDYEDDYKNILNDVNNEIYNLSFGFLGSTYLNMDVSNRSGNSLTEFYSILTYVKEQLLKAIDITIKNSHHHLEKTSELMYGYKIRSISNETFRYIQNNPSQVKAGKNGYVVNKAIGIRKQVTYDTNENRFLKFLLKRIIKKINEFIKIYKYQNESNKKLTEKNKVIIHNLENIRKEIQKRIKISFLNNVSDEYRSSNISMVFTMASGYREIYKYYLMLQKQLDIKNELLGLSMKDLPLLYEYWCFIKINSLLSKKYKLISSDFIKLKTDGIYVALKKGIESSLTYLNEETNEKFTVYYNKNSNSRTVNQKPDNILSLSKANSNVKYEFVFDAKYRVDYSEKYKDIYGCVGPKVDDINTMHRYRDSIVYKNKDNEDYRNCVFGAFVLFPYTDEELFKSNKFYKSIEEVNIGAFPFLPSTTKLMEEFLDELIYESSYSIYDRSLDNVGYEEKLKDEYFSNRNVLIGQLRDKKQLEINLKHNFYYMPYKNIDLIKNKIEYIAIYQSQKHFKEEVGIYYYGKIKKIHEKKRRDIVEILRDEKKDDNLYYYFEIEDWCELDNKIKPGGAITRGHLYTSKYLLNNSKCIHELYIKSKDEFRVWEELKRITDEKYIMISNDNDLSKIEGFKVKENEILISDKITVKSKGKIYEYSLDDFKKKTREIIKRCST